MPYSLIEEAWIPVLWKGGRIGSIAPWQITDGESPLRIGAPRPDLTGALTEFLIGLVQTALPPATEREWRKLRDSPPTPKLLHEFFSQYADAFMLDGEGPRFMQDLTLTHEEAGDPSPIGSLLIDSPGDSTIQHNSDLFIKRGRLERLCPACAAAALFTIQCFAPAGGRNIRTSLRGGGPLSTLVLGETLWETVWNNVLPRDTLNALGGDTSKPRDGGVFPWLAPTRSSEKGEETHLGEVHPLHKYWGMPRRIRLQFEEGIQRVCGLCNRKAERSVPGYLTRPGGYNYSGSWIHPLSPIRDMGEQYLAVKGSSEGLGYQNWLGLVYREVEERNPVQAAQVVKNYRNHRVPPGRGREAHFRIWAFGYDMDNMKARAWSEGIMPAWAVSDEAGAERLAVETSRLIRSATRVHEVLQWALKEAFYSDYVKLRKDTSFMESVSARFWSTTRGPFFALVARLVDEVTESNEGPFELRRQWLSHAAGAARDIFDYLADSEALPANDPHGYARGWNILRNKLSPLDTQIKKILDLPSEAA
ncbi:MAG: type I-E CRISPR-associated protein Cse1/CasA [Desulfobacteraceae bacterium]